MCRPPSFELSGNVWLWRAAKTRAERCRWLGRPTERKPRLVTQLDEVAACGLIGYAACAVYITICITHTNRTAWCFWGRAKTLLPTCCSTSPRLSGEIRSQAHLFPLLPSSSPFAPLLLTACPLLLLSLCFSSQHPYTSSCNMFFFIFSFFCHHAAERKPSPLWLHFILLSLSFSPFSVSFSMLISVIRLWGISWD